MNIFIDASTDYPRRTSTQRFANFNRTILYYSGLFKKARVKIQNNTYRHKNKV